MSHTVIGMFDNASEANNAVQELLRKGFTDEMIDLSAKRDCNNEDVVTDRKEEESDSITGFFRNLFGGDDDTASRYSTVAKNGCQVVTVHARSMEEAKVASYILDHYGAVDIDDKATQYGYNRVADTDSSYQRSDMDTNYTKSDMDASYVRSDMDTNYTKSDMDASYVRSDMDTTADLDRTMDVDRTMDLDRTVEGSTSIPIIEEQLNVGKREVERGAARVRSRIIERPIEENLRLREERIVVERNPVNRTATDADFAAFREGEIQLTEHAEVPVVSKEARVVEEVRIGKEVNERQETIRDTVRKTEVDIDRVDSDDLTTRRTETRRSDDLNDDRLV